MQTIQTNQSHPLLAQQYPLHYGAYCPHILYHTSQANKVTGEYQEIIWVSSYIRNAKEKEWTKPKPKSHHNATIALLLLDEQGMPHIRSIYLDPHIGPHEYAAHPSYTQRTALSENERNTMPSPYDIYLFIVNPDHWFNDQQASMLKTAMLKRFPSDHAQYIEAISVLKHKANHPNLAHDFPTLPMKMSAPPVVNQDGTNYQQMIHLTEQRPWVIENFPSAYGLTERQEYWIKTSQKPGCLRKEAAYFKTWQPDLNRYGPTKRKTPAKSTICIARRDTNPQSPQYNLPHFDHINLCDGESAPTEVFEFALRNYFTIEQRSLIMLYLIKHLGEGASEVSVLNSKWASEPAVPATP